MNVFTPSSKSMPVIRRPMLYVPSPLSATVNETSAVRASFVRPSSLSPAPCSRTLYTYVPGWLNVNPLNANAAVRPLSGLPTVTDAPFGMAALSTLSDTLDWPVFGVNSNVNDSPLFQSRPVIAFANPTADSPLAIVYVLAKCATPSA